MKTKLQRFKAWLLMLVVMVLCAGNAWGETTHSYDFSNVENWVLTSNGTEHPVAGSSTSTPPGTALSGSTIYYVSDNAAFSFHDGTNTPNAYFPSSTTASYLLMGKTGEYMTLPSYSNEKIKSIHVTCTSSGSTSVKVSIISGTETVSAEQTWSTKGATYNYSIGDNYTNKELSICVTNNYNAQISKVEIVTESSQTDPVNPTITANTISNALTNKAISLASMFTTNSSGAKTYTVTATPRGNATSPAKITDYSIDGDSFTPLVAGSYTVQLSQAATTGYNAGTATNTFSVTAPVKHNVIWSVNGKETSQEVVEGAAIPFPANPANIGDKVFVGWYGSTYSNESTAPTYVTSATMGTQDVTYYAVFATPSETTSTYPILTLNFLDEGWNFPKGSSEKVVNESTYTCNGQSIAIAGSDGNGFYLMQSTATNPTPWALLFGKEGAYLKLPVINSSVTSLKVYPAAGGSPSTKVTWNVYADDVIASEQKDGITGLKDNAVDVSINEYYANSQLTVKVTNANNLQISKIEYYGLVASYSNYCTTVVNLQSLTVSGTPTKTTYEAGESFDPAGLTVTGTYSDESTATITDGCF